MRGDQTMLESELGANIIVRPAPGGERVVREPVGAANPVPRLALA